MVTTGKIREAVGVFDDMHALEKAVTELETAAFSRDTISMLGNEYEMRKKLGVSAVNPERVEDEDDTPRQAPIRTEEKAIGTGIIIGGGAYAGAVGALVLAGAAISVPAVIAAAAIGAGGGGILAKILGDHLNEHIEDQIDQGGLVLWVQIKDEDLEGLACEILKKHGARHVHVHEVK